jgi:acyl-CoA dehydrogenase
MAWDFSTDPEFEDRLAWMREFVREEIWPIETIADEIGQAELDRINAPLQQQVIERGLWAAHLPPELGGQGFGQVKLGLMNEVLGTSIHAPPVFGCQAPDSGNSEILALAGTPEQKERWLQPLLAGELRSAFSMTEPETPGSDPTQLEARARRDGDGDGWVLSGHKWFTSNGSIADFLIVMAVTDPDAPSHQRASMFIVPVGAEGVKLVRDVPTMEHPQPRFGVLGGHTEILYQDVQLGPDALLGKEGDGFLIAQQRLVPGRIHHCMRWLGMARRAFDAMCERALYRPVKGGLLKDTQTVQGWIADSAAEMKAAKLMTLHAAWTMDRYGSSAARTEVSMIKYFGAKVLHDVIDRAVQIHGALGYSADMPLEALYRYARHARFVDGADEVHREAVARRLLRAYEAPADGVPSDHVPTRREAARRKFAHVLATVPERAERPQR